MKNLKLFVLVAITAAAWAAIAVRAASATTLTGSGGTTLGTGTTISAENEGTVTLHPPIGDIECKKSSVSGKTTNAGGESVSVSASVESLSWSECNATVTVLAKGSLSLEGAGNGYGTLRSTGAEVTIEFAGFHCIYSTNNTDIGTVTGSAMTGGNATLDVGATIPRTGGRSGAFCGSTAAWTGSYKITAPNPLNIDPGAGQAAAEFPGKGGPLTYTVGVKEKIVWRNLTDVELNIVGGDVNHNGAVLNTVGGLCTRIAMTATCNNIEVECLKPGLATVTLGNPRVGTAVIRCD